MVLILGDSVNKIIFKKIKSFARNKQVWRNPSKRTHLSSDNAAISIYIQQYFTYKAFNLQKPPKYAFATPNRSTLHFPNQKQPRHVLEVGNGK